MTQKALTEAGFCDALDSIKAALYLIEQRSEVDRLLVTMSTESGRKYAFKDMANSEKMLFYVDSDFNGQVSRPTEYNDW